MRVTMNNVMKIMLENLTKESKLTELNSEKLTEQLKFYLKCSVLLTRLKKSNKLLRRLWLQQKMFSQRRKLMLPLIFYPYILMGHHRNIKTFGRSADIRATDPIY